MRQGGGVAAGAKGSAAVEEGNGKAKAKVKSDIDDIFAGVKRLKAEKAEQQAERWVWCVAADERWENRYHTTVVYVRFCGAIGNATFHS